MHPIRRYPALALVAAWLFAATTAAHDRSVECEVAEELHVAEGLQYLLVETTLDAMEAGREDDGVGHQRAALG